MAKVVQFPGNAPKQLGPQKVRLSGRSARRKENPAQLSLFTGRMVSINRNNIFEQALAADEAGHTQQARALYQQAIASGNQPADAWCNLGIIEFAGGNLAGAISAFSHCLSQSPRHFEAHYNMANAWAEAGNYQLAELHYRMAIDIAPDFPNSYYNLGLTLALKKDYAAAIENLTHYCRLTSPEEHVQARELIAHLRTLVA
ncbi:MAG: hypothetical protein KatS3mg032_0187 [Cyclobacteriaceae bacterium]|nr:MAG: hypothetical protein KatS3mg032_0187 [Cyclobacteriaceae bacterium]